MGEHSGLINLLRSRQASLAASLLASGEGKGPNDPPFRAVGPRNLGEISLATAASCGGRPSRPSRGSTARVLTYSLDRVVSRLRRSLVPVPRSRACFVRLFRSALLIALAFRPTLFAQQEMQVAPVMTGRYHFLGPEDELAILQEETVLKGFIDVFQGENESDAILSYQIISGSRNGNRVEFTTRAIHEKHYHFSGRVEQGRGKRSGDPDYLQLVGVLETCTSNSVTGKNEVAQQNVVFKSIGRGESEP
jgi:hypothetical protein